MCSGTDRRRGKLRKTSIGPVQGAKSGCLGWSGGCGAVELLRLSGSGRSRQLLGRRVRWTDGFPGSGVVAVRYEEERLEVGVRVVRRTARVTEAIRSTLRRTPASVESSITMRAPRGGRQVLAHAFVAMQGKPLQVPGPHSRSSTRPPGATNPASQSACASTALRLLARSCRWSRCSASIRALNSGSPQGNRAQTHRHAHHELGQVHHR